MQFFIPDEYGKKIKKAPGLSAENKRIARSWLKFYAKVKKKVPVVTNHYHLVRNEAGKLLADARELEQLLIGAMMRTEEQLNEEEKHQISDIIEDMKKIRPHLDSNFLIGKEDQEIHATIEGLIQMQTDLLSGKTDILIAQSEVENLMEMLYEGIEKEKPDLFELSSFYVQHTDHELAELPHRKQLERIHELYLEEFADPIHPVLMEMVEKQDNCSEAEAERKVQEFLKKMSTI